MSKNEYIKRQLWYVKSNGKVIGPFPSGGIRRSMLLGRFTRKDQVSVDKANWDRVGDIPELMPPEMRKAGHDDDAELLAARLREDERSGLDRRVDSKDRLPQEERRRVEAALVERHREAKTALRQLGRKKDLPVMGMLIIGMLTLIAIGYGVYLGAPDLLPDPDCSSDPAAGVDWHNCRLDNLVADTADLEGANLGNASLMYSRFSGARLNTSDIRYADLSGSDLSHAELREANMKGTMLRNTDLSYADLSGADLRYANLTGANLGGTVLIGAQLDHAIWPDGRECAEGSVGNCRILP
ncbi:MAG: pentapeptide repeat-containing protein [Gammaproteobacteria bacterium]|nr:pentapeptide repeat-containing protein [Gammaproteobacteria bacterium]